MDDLLKNFLLPKIYGKIVGESSFKAMKKKKSVYIFCSLSWSSLSLIRYSHFNKKLRHTRLLRTTALGYKGWRKNSLRERRNIFVSDDDPQRFSFIIYTTLILIYDVLYSFRLCYIQFKEVKILWGPGAEGKIWGPEAG